jgi:hypothetical protein
MLGALLTWYLNSNKKKKAKKKTTKLKTGKALRKSLKKKSKKTTSTSTSSSADVSGTGTTDTTGTSTTDTVSDTSTNTTEQKVDNTEENEKLARAKFSEGLRDLMSFEIEFQGFIPQLHTNMFIWFELPEKHILANYASMVAGIDKTTTRGGEYVLNRYYVEKVTRSFDEGSMVTKVTLNPFASNLSSYYKLYTDAINAYDQANCSSDSSSSTSTSETITVTGKPSTSEASKYYEYKDYTKTWKNLCMSTSCKGQYPGTLKDNPKGVYEHEITCSKCDSDYDVTTGADKSGSYRFYLQDANGKSNSHGNIDTSIGGGSDGSTNGATSSTGASSANCVNSSSMGASDGSVPANVQAWANAATNSTNPEQIVRDCWAFLAGKQHLHYKHYSGFINTPDKCVSSGRANCCDGTRVLASMCAYKRVYIDYIHVSNHVYGYYNGVKYDWCVRTVGTSWAGGGKSILQQTTYPKLPF